VFVPSVGPLMLQNLTHLNEAVKHRSSLALVCTLLHKFFSIERRIRSEECITPEAAQVQCEWRGCEDHWIEGMGARALKCNAAHGSTTVCKTHCRITLFSLRIPAAISPFDGRIGSCAEKIRCSK
jgi:hypothetical protein